MAGYIVVDLTITDPDGFAQYREMVPPTVAQYGGRYLVRGGAIEVLEGDWNPRRITVLEFPSVEQAKAWWDSPEYAEAKALRMRTTKTNLLVIQGT